MTKSREREQPQTPFFPLQRPSLANDLAKGDLKLTAMIGRSPTRVFPAHKAIIGAGEEHDSIYQIRNGWCARIRYLPDGRSQILDLLLPGDFFAIEMIYQTLHMDDVVAITSATVEYADRSTVEKAMRDDPRLALRLTWQLLEDERRMRNWLTAMGRGNAEERLALLLLDIRGRLALGGLIEPESTVFAFPMTQQRIGEMLGLTSVHVNRTMQHFRKGGYVTSSMGAMKINDLEAIRRLALPLLDEFEKHRPEYGSSISIDRNGQPPGNRGLSRTNLGRDFGGKGP
jgi:CRP/FNR family transcriptional regulator, anaerobic regulatory protein